MKCPKQNERRNKRSRVAGLNDARLTELLKECLQKVCELQADLQRDEDRNPEAAGYAACAMETLSFLSAEGVPSTHPIVRQLKARFMDNRN
ncbi:uncharacterized protein LOC116177639 [Photinus pyralis]|uniref:uncharacterized protein LOC116177639 n=1 Tax=Photinus pyralis TaxID=7054 RepID=UPI0012677F70|nr:uncharacterized protein LOC116177639 [Photinus pyralis]